MRLIAVLLTSLTTESRQTRTLPCDSIASGEMALTRTVVHAVRSPSIWGTLLITKITSVAGGALTGAVHVVADTVITAAGVATVRSKHVLHARPVAQVAGVAGAAMTGPCVAVTEPFLRTGATDRALTAAAQPEGAVRTRHIAVGTLESCVTRTSAILWVATTILALTTLQAPKAVCPGAAGVVAVNACPAGVALAQARLTVTPAMHADAHGRAVTARVTKRTGAVAPTCTDTAAVRFAADARSARDARLSTVGTVTSCWTAHLTLVASEARGTLALTSHLIT